MLKGWENHTFCLKTVLRYKKLVEIHCNGVQVQVWYNGGVITILSQQRLQKAQTLNFYRLSEVVSRKTSSVVFLPFLAQKQQEQRQQHGGARNTFQNIGSH